MTVQLEGWMLTSKQLAMFKLRLGDLIWLITVAALAIFLLLERSVHHREIETLTKQVKDLENEISNNQISRGARYNNLEVMVVESSNGRIDKLAMHSAQLAKIKQSTNQ